MALALFQNGPRCLPLLLSLRKISLSKAGLKRLLAMEACRRNERIARYRPPGVVPLELWDLLLNGRMLWETMTEPEFPGILRQAIDVLQLGDGQTRSEGRVPELIAGFDSLHIAGGRSQEPAIRSAVQTLGLPMTFSRTPDYPGESEGLCLLRDFGGTTGWLCDLGQSAFKVSTEMRHMQFRRDLRRLPVRTDSPDESVPEQRHQLREWLVESLHSFSTNVTAPNAILFAMPSRLNDMAVPEGSSYIGMAGDETLLADTIRAADLDPKRVLVLNDAELAALDALPEPALQGYAKTLVVTLGFGFGAALAIRRQVAT